METSTIEKHSFIEDALAILWGAALVALGLAIYQKAMLLTGSLSGVALLIHYASGYGFGLVFFLINLPFMALAVQRMGWPFTLRSLIAVAIFSVLSRLTPGWLDIANLNPVYAAIVGGGLMGTGLLILFRHRTALGGLNVLALYLQDNFGVRAGYFMLAVDMAILATSFLVLDWQHVALSAAGAAALNLVIALNHRQGRYVGVS